MTDPLTEEDMLTPFEAGRLIDAVSMAAGRFLDRELTPLLIGKVTEHVNAVCRQVLSRMGRHPLEWRVVVYAKGPERRLCNDVVRDPVAVPMTFLEYCARFNYEPRNDDLHRVNCRRAGEIGHMMCGLCLCGQPRHVCAHPLGHFPWPE